MSYSLQNQNSNTTATSDNVTNVRLIKQKRETDKMLANSLLIVTKDEQQDISKAMERIEFLRLGLRSWYWNIYVTKMNDRDKFNQVAKALDEALTESESFMPDGRIWKNYKPVMEQIEVLESLQQACNLSDKELKPLFQAAKGRILAKQEQERNILGIDPSSSTEQRGPEYANSAEYRYWQAQERLKEVEDAIKSIESKTVIDPKDEEWLDQLQKRKIDLNAVARKNAYAANVEVPQHVKELVGRCD